MFPVFLNTPFKKAGWTIVFVSSWMTDPVVLMWRLLRVPFLTDFSWMEGKAMHFHRQVTSATPTCSRLATAVRCICQPACMCRQYLLLFSVFNFTLCMFAYAQSSEDNLQELDPSFHCESQGSNCSSGLGIASSFWAMSLALLLFLICSQWVKLGHLVCAFLLSGKTAVFSWSHIVGCRHMWSTCEGRAPYNCLFVQLNIAAHGVVELFWQHCCPRLASLIS